MTDPLPEPSELGDETCGPEEPPWTDSDQYRRDCERHRANLLSWLAVASQGLTLLAICLLICIGTLLPPSFSDVGAVIGGSSTLLFAVGAVLGGVAWFLGRRDLSAMRQGKIDRAGERQTQDAVKLARWGTWTNGSVVFVILVAIIWTLT